MMVYANDGAYCDCLLSQSDNLGVFFVVFISNEFITDGIGGGGGVEECFFSLQYIRLRWHVLLCCLSSVKKLVFFL